MAEHKDNLVENAQKQLLNIEAFTEKNQKALMIGGGAIVLIIGGLLYLFMQYLPEQNLKAQKAMYMAEFAFAKDSFDLALNGNAAYKGFANVADNYSMTKAGKLAQYYAGISCLNLKKFDDAIKYLDKFSTDDPIIGALRLNALGDAYAEKGQMDQAVKQYQNAASFSDNEKYTPLYLFKTGAAYEYLKDYTQAEKYYTQVRDLYPNSDESRDIEKYIARAGAAAK
ncbi:MAG: tetratricopeptide repeat protein [Bacteroidetes bacterium]|nr:tetratricopeptide repeat protein [Bacteroidota bacterium]